MSLEGLWSCGWELCCVVGAHHPCFLHSHITQNLNNPSFMHLVMGLLNACILSIPCKTREIITWSLICSRMEGFEMGLKEGFEMRQALEWLQQRNKVNICQKSCRESWQISKTYFNWYFWRGRCHVGALVQETKFKTLHVEEDARYGDCSLRNPAGVDCWLRLQMAIVRLPCQHFW